MCVPQTVTYVAVEKGMELKEVSFGRRTKMQALELLQLVKKHISRRSNSGQ